MRHSGVTCYEKHGGPIVNSKQGSGWSCWSVCLAFNVFVLSTCQCSVEVLGGSTTGDILDFSEPLIFLSTVPKALALYKDLSRSKCQVGEGSQSVVDEMGRKEGGSSSWQSECEQKPTLISGLCCSKASGWWHLTRNRNFSAKINQTSVWFSVLEHYRGRLKIPLVLLIA